MNINGRITMGTTGGRTCGSTRRGITIRKDVQLNVDSMPCRGSGMTTSPCPQYITWSPSCSDFVGNIFFKSFLWLSLQPTRAVRACVCVYVRARVRA